MSTPETFSQSARILIKLSEARNEARAWTRQERSRRLSQGERAAKVYSWKRVAMFERALERAIAAKEVQP